MYTNLHMKKVEHAADWNKCTTVKISRGISSMGETNRCWTGRLLWNCSLSYLRFLLAWSHYSLLPLFLEYLFHTYHYR